MNTQNLSIPITGEPEINITIRITQNPDKINQGLALDPHVKDLVVMLCEKIESELKKD